MTARYCLSTAGCYEQLWLWIPDTVADLLSRSHLVWCCHNWRFFELRHEKVTGLRRWKILKIAIVVLFCSSRRDIVQTGLNNFSSVSRTMLPLVMIDCVSKRWILFLLFVLSQTSHGHDEDAHTLRYTRDNFSMEVGKKNHFIMFYAPW